MSPSFKLVYFQLRLVSFNLLLMCCFKAGCASKMKSKCFFPLRFPFQSRQKQHQTHLKTAFTVKIEWKLNCSADGSSKCEKSPNWPFLQGVIFISAWSLGLLSVRISPEKRSNLRQVTELHSCRRCCAAVFNSLPYYNQFSKFPKKRWASNIIAFREMIRIPGTTGAHLCHATRQRWF